MPYLVHQTKILSQPSMPPRAISACRSRIKPYIALVSLMSEPALESPPTATSTTGRWMNLWTVLALGLVVYVIRMLGPEDLADFYHQERAAAYVMDVLRNGNWICQYGFYGEVTSKPPMLT